jgi:hypothetical protein
MCDPSAIGNGSASYAGLRYAASAAPIQVTVTGACTDPSNGSLNALVGQHLTYGVTAGSLVPTSYRWDIDGSWFAYTVYGSIGSSSFGQYYDKREIWGPSDPNWNTLATVPLYYDVSGYGSYFAATPQCIVTLADPTTGLEVGTAVATNNVKIWGPYFKFTSTPTAVMYHTDSSSGDVDGVKVDDVTAVLWNASVGTEALFSITTGQGFGQWAYAQICSLYRRRRTSSLIWVTDDDFAMYLDSCWPYTPECSSLPTGWPYGPTVTTKWPADSASAGSDWHGASDSPSHVGLTTDTGFHVVDSFQMHVMYQPPAYVSDSDPAEWIALAYDSWGWTANPTRSTAFSQWPSFSGSTWDGGITDWPSYTMQWQEVFVGN